MSVNNPVKSVRRLALLICGLLWLALFAMPGTPSPTAAQGLAAPLAQRDGPGTAPLGSTEQNNCIGYLTAKGYPVDGVGHPQNADGSLDSTAVMVVMPFQSPQFDPEHLLDSDPETVRQIFSGFNALHRFYPTAQRLTVALQWEEVIVAFPVAAAAWQALLDQTITSDNLWTGVAQNATVLDAVSFSPVTQRNFSSKDFISNKRQLRGVPPSAYSLQQRVQFNLQPSSAYLSPDAAARLVVRVVGGGATVAGTQVQIGAARMGQDGSVLLTTPVGANGEARGSFSAAAQPAGQALLSANSGAMALGASVPIMFGPVVSGTAALSAVADSLRLQGLDVLGVECAPGQANPCRVLARMAAARFDDKVRGQILTAAGTLFTVYPQATVAEAVLLNRTQGTSYQLFFQLRRADWDAWLNGTLNTAQLWQQISLSRVVDFHTGQPAQMRDFNNKDFGAAARREIAISHDLASSITPESWGNQLYTARFVVPPVAQADGFALASRTGQAEFAIYSSGDPVTPVYDSAQDSSGDQLRQLQLGAGQYLLAARSSQAPATVKLTYVERMIDNAGR